MKFYVKARQRCTNPKNDSYKYYGARGIKFLLSPLEVKTLWERDSASQMTCPSIDRKDANLSYCLSNCRFIEKALNNRRGISIISINKEGKKTRYLSLRAAVIILGVSSNANIYSALKGKQKRAYGYRWEYA